MRFTGIAQMLINVLPEFQATDLADMTAMANELHHAGLVIWWQIPTANGPVAGQVRLTPGVTLEHAQRVARVIWLGRGKKPNG